MSKEKVLAGIRVIAIGGAIWAFGIFGILIIAIIFGIVRMLQGERDDE